MVPSDPRGDRSEQVDRQSGLDSPAGQQRHDSGRHLPYLDYIRAVKGDTDTTRQHAAHTPVPAPKWVASVQVSGPIGDTSTTCCLRPEMYVP